LNKYIRPGNVICRYACKNKQ